MFSNPCAQLGQFAFLASADSFEPRDLPAQIDTAHQAVRIMFRPHAQPIAQAGQIQAAIGDERDRARGMNWRWSRLNDKLLITLDLLVSAIGTRLKKSSLGFAVFDCSSFDREVSAKCGEMVERGRIAGAPDLAIPCVTAITASLVGIARRKFRRQLRPAARHRDVDADLGGFRLQHQRADRLVIRESPLPLLLLARCDGAQACDLSASSGITRIEQADCGVVLGLRFCEFSPPAFGDVVDARAGGYPGAL